MEKIALVKRLRTLAQATDGLLGKETLAFDDIARVQRQLADLQSEPLAGPGVDLAIENTIHRLRLKITEKHFADPAVAAAGFSLGRLFARPQSPEQAARQQQAQVKKTLATFRQEIGHTLFAFEM